MLVSVCTLDIFDSTFGDNSDMYSVEHIGKHIGLVKREHYFFSYQRSIKDGSRSSEVNASTWDNFTPHK